MTQLPQRSKLVATSLASDGLWTSPHFTFYEEQTESMAARVLVAPLLIEGSSFVSSCFKTGPGDRGTNDALYSQFEIESVASWIATSKVVSDMCPNTSPEEFTTGRVSTYQPRMRRTPWRPQSLEFC